MIRASIKRGDIGRNGIANGTWGSPGCSSWEACGTGEEMSVEVIVEEQNPTN